MLNKPYTHTHKQTGMFTYVQQKRHQSPGNLFALGGRLDDIVQEIVAALDLIPVEQVRLGELKFVQIVVLHERNADAVERRKDPATARVLLVGQRLALGLHFIGENVLGVFQGAARQRHLERVDARAHILCQHIFLAFVEVAAPFTQL